MYERASKNLREKLKDQTIGTEDYLKEKSRRSSIVMEEEPTAYATPRPED